MKIRIKKDLETARCLLDKLSLPSSVVEEILGKTFVCGSYEEPFQIPARLGESVGMWSIPAECVEILSLE